MLPTPPPRLRAALLLLLPLLLPPATAAAQGPSTTVILVRHAEKAPVEGADPPLSAAGITRASALADALADAGVQAVFATQFQRTRDTARPLAARLGLPVLVRDAGAGTDYARALAREIRERHAGQTVLVVGHSNSTVEVVRALGGAEVGPIPESQYDDLFILLIPPEGPVGTVRTRYGAAGEGRG